MYTNMVVRTGRVEHLSSADGTVEERVRDAEADVVVSVGAGEHSEPAVAQQSWRAEAERTQRAVAHGRVHTHAPVVAARRGQLVQRHHASILLQCGLQLCSDLRHPTTQYNTDHPKCNRSLFRNQITTR
jgi:hypothetical protein